MDETILSYHTPETKRQAKQWIEKGQPGPIKARVHTSRTKQILLAFFDNKDLNYTNIKPRGSIVNTSYIMKVLGTFMNPLMKKRPEMLSQKCFFPLGKCSGPPHPDVDGQQHPVVQAPALIPGSCPGRLLVQEGEGRAG
jgi:hypothetical protein